MLYECANAFTVTHGMDRRRHLICLADIQIRASVFKVRRLVQQEQRGEGRPESEASACGNKDGE